MIRTLRISALLLLIITSAATPQTAKRPITLEDLWKVKRLGKPSISPDGKWALTLTKGPAPELLLFPTGAGAPRKLSLPFKPVWASFVPGGARILVVHEVEEGEQRYTIVGIEDGKLQHFPTPGHAGLGGAFSPDGNSVAYVMTSGQPVVVSLSEGGAPRELPGPPLKANEGILQWSADGRYLFIVWQLGLPARISRREIATGKTTAWLEVQPADPSGVSALRTMVLTPDGRTVVFDYDRTEASDLFVAEGLK